MCVEQKKSPNRPFKKAKYIDENGVIVVPTEPNAYKFEAFIFDAFERLQDMVQEFSSFAKLPEVKLSSGDIRPVITELLELFIHNHNEIKWNVYIPNTLPEILMDASALHRALLNVITNAVEALEYSQNIEKKCIEITITHDHTKGIISIKIEDSGIGLAPNERERIFDPYFSLTAAYSYSSISILYNSDISLSAIMSISK